MEASKQKIPVQPGGHSWLIHGKDRGDRNHRYPLPRLRALVRGWPRGYQPNLTPQKTGNLTHSRIPTSGNARLRFCPLCNAAAEDGERRAASSTVGGWTFPFLTDALHKLPGSPSFLHPTGEKRREEISRLHLSTFNEMRSRRTLDCNDDNSDVEDGDDDDAGNDDGCLHFFPCARVSKRNPLLQLSLIWCNSTLR